MVKKTKKQETQTVSAPKVPDHVAEVLDHDIVFESSVSDVQITDDMDEQEKELRFTTKVNWMNPALGLVRITLCSCDGCAARTPLE